jgi:hypothetical protein
LQLGDDGKMRKKVAADGQKPGYRNTRVDRQGGRKYLRNRRSRKTANIRERSQEFIKLVKTLQADARSGQPSDPNVLKAFYESQFIYKFNRRIYSKNHGVFPWSHYGISIPLQI